MTRLIQNIATLSYKKTEEYKNETTKMCFILFDYIQFLMICKLALFGEN